MSQEVAFQVLGMALLSGTIALGYRMVLRRLDLAPGVQMRIAVLLVLGVAGGGFWGAIAWWQGYAGAFAWRLPPLAGRMLAAAGVSFALLCVLAIRRPHAAHLQLVFTLVLIYLLPLVAVIPLFHLRQFNFGMPVTYAFFAIVFTLTLGSVWFLIRPAGFAEVLPEKAIASRPLLWGMAILALVWGLVLFTGMRLPLLGAEFSVYDLLTSRLMAVMSLSVAAAAVFALRVPGVMNTALAFMLAYGLGAVAAGLSGPAYGQRIAWSYVEIWGIVALVAGGMLVAGRLGRRG